MTAMSAITRDDGDPTTPVAAREIGLHP